MWGPLAMEGAGARVGLGGAVSLLAMSAQREFDVVIVAEPEGGYSVFVPELPSVATQGETIEEARANAQEAIEAYLEVMHEDGLPIPTVHRDRVAVHGA
jgi:predicted RNase H-like HicB family nuclease